ncbi:MAG: cytochrome [Geobacteraceae bacterium]|nr:MAG: cytochrome [Geobacteraceae bacterium]
MKIGKKDWMFIALALAVLLVFYIISGEEKTTKVPYDETHRQFYDMLQAGKKKSEVDPLCAPCHDGVKIPFPHDHPAKPGGGPMRCLFCHKTKKIGEK